MPIVDIPYSVAVEPSLLSRIDTPSSDPVALRGLGAGVKLMLPDGGAVMAAPVFSMAPSLPAGGATDVALMLFAIASKSRSGAEGSTD